MGNKYKNINVKVEVADILVDAAARLNEASGGYGKKVTVAGLVTRLAEAYSGHMSDSTISGNNEDWIIDGVPVILTSDGAKHFRELKTYEPVHCAVMVSDFIRSEAMKRRYADVRGNDNE